MKKALGISFIISIFSFLFLSCGYEIPQSVSVKTTTNYSFAFGNLEKDLSEYISAESLGSGAGISSGNATIKFYDYNPEEKDVQQEFVLDCNMMKIPVNLGEYFKDLDFTKNLQENFSFEKEIKIPSVAAGNLSSPLDTDSLTTTLNSKITGRFSITGLPGLSIPASYNDSISEVSARINITSPEMESVTFYSGYINLVLDTADSKTGLTTALTVELRNMSGTVISKAENVELGANGTVQLPLSGKTIEKEMKLVINGTAENTRSAVDFTMTASLDSSSKVTKITGLTLDPDADPISVPITNQKITVTLDESIVKCIIGQGTLSMGSAIPSGWSGVTATPAVALSGSLAVENAAWTDGNDGSRFFKIDTDLSGKDFKSGELIINGNIGIKLTNATVVFENGACPTINMDVNCDVTNVSSVTLDLSKGSSGLTEDNLSYTYSKSLPSEVVDSVKTITLDEPEFDVEYINSLPSGNDIVMKVNSTFLGITDGTSTLSPVKTEYSAADSIKGAADKTVSTSSALDITAKIELPGADASNPTYTTLTNITVGSTYKIGTKITPVFNWKSVTIDPSSLTSADQDGSVDTDFSLKKIFNSYVSDLGSDFLSKINFNGIKVYGYFVVPEGVGLDAFSFTGNISAYTASNKSDKQDLVNGAIDSKNKLPELIQNSKGTVISKLLSSEASFYDDTEIMTLLNGGGDDTVKLDYSIGLSGSEVTITKDQISNATDSNISVVMRVVLPLSCTVTDEISIDISKMASIPDTDIFNRSEATNIDDAKKYIDVIKETGIIYTANNNILNYEAVDGVVPVPKMTLSFNDDAASGNPASKVNSGNPYEMVFGSGKFTIAGNEFTDVLACYPVKLTLKAIIPKGTMYMPRSMGVGVNIVMKIATDGTIKLF